MRDTQILVHIHLLLDMVGVKNDVGLIASIILTSIVRISIKE